MHDMVIEITRNPPTTIENLQATEYSCIITLNIVNHICLATIIDETKPWGIFRIKNYTLQ